MTENCQRVQVSNTCATLLAIEQIFHVIFGHRHWPWLLFHDMIRVL